MAALATVQDYVDEARRLLQDKVEPYRYEDADLVGSLNNAILEARKLRPDLFTAYFRTSLPSFSATAMDAAVSIDEQYRMPFVYYMVGQQHLADDENAEDNRAAAFLNLFTSKLGGLV